MTLVRMTCLVDAASGQKVDVLGMLEAHLQESAKRQLRKTFFPDGKDYTVQRTMLEHVLQTVRD